MNLIDSQYLQALQNSIGGAGLNLIESSPLFGPLPPLQTLPPGATITLGSSFFGPQIRPPFNFQLPGVPGGTIIGQGIQQFMANRGQFYVPRGVNLFDLAQGREFNRGLRENISLGTFQDEERLARVIERALRAFYQTDSPALKAYSNALAQVNIGPLEMLGLSRYLPGGSAADFAKQFYLAGQNIRDYTNQRYALGLPDNQIKVMTQRLLDFFGPAGEINLQRTRGLQLQDLGALANQLTSFGLLNTNVSQQDLQRAAQDLGTDLSKLSRNDVENLKGIVRPLNIGRQLQSYAEVVATLREIMGDPNAPIPQVIQELQNLTGGRMQEYTPAQLEQLLNRIRETARTANISMNVMRSIVAEGATMYRQMGLSPTLGGLVSMQAAAATVASQTLATGPGVGRLHPDRETDIRFRMMTRGIQSPGFRISTNIMRLLESIDTANLTPEQRQIYQQMLDRAGRFSYDERSLEEALTGLEQLGIGRTTALMVTRQAVPSSYIEQHPDLLTNLTAAQAKDVQRSVGRSGRLFARLVMSDPNSTMAQRLRTLAAQTNMTEEQVGEILAQSYIYAAGDTRADRLTYLRSRGFNLTARELQQLEIGLNAFPAFRREYKARSLDRPEQLRSLFGPDQIAAIEAENETIAERMAGQAILSDLNAEYRSDTISRLLGAADQSPSSLKDLVTRAFGFVPNREFMKELRRAGGKKSLTRLTELREEIKEARERGDIATVRQKEAEARRILRGFGEIERRFSGIAGTRYLREFLDKAQAENVQDLAKRLNDPNISEEEKFETLQKLAGFTLEFSDQDIRRLAAKLPAGSRQEFFEFMQMARAEAQDFRRYEREEDPGRREQLRKSLLRSAPGIFQGYEGLVREAKLAEQVEESRGRHFTLQERFDAFKRFSEELKAFKSAKSSDERRQTFEKLRADVIQNRLAVFKRGKGGRLEVDKDLIRLMVQSSGYRGEDAAQMVEELTLEAEKLQENLSFITSPEVGAAPSDEVLKETQRLAESANIDFSKLKTFKPKDLTEVQRAYIYGGDTTIESVSPELQRMHDIYQSVQRIQKLANLTMPEDPRRKRITLLQMQEQLRRSGLFDDKGRLKQEAFDVIMNQYGPDLTSSEVQSAGETIRALNQLSVLVSGGPEAYEKLLREDEEVQKAKEAMGEAAAEGVLGNATIRFVDANTGEDLGQDIRIEVELARNTNAGRDASNFLNERLWRNLMYL